MLRGRQGRRDLRRELRARTAALSATAVLVGAAIDPAAATDFGPGVVAPFTNASGANRVVGGSSITATGGTNATNVTGGSLTFDPAAGPSPGAISVQTGNGNALQAAGAPIFVINGAGVNGLNIQTGGGHGVLANGAGSIVTMNGATINSTGVGDGLVAIGAGAQISATNVTLTATSTSRGLGAVAENGATINLLAGTQITRGGGLNSVGLGASDAGSVVTATVPITVTMTGRSATGIYLHDGGLVYLQPGSMLQINATSSVGIAVDNTSVPLGALNGVTINLDGVHVAGQASSTGLVALNAGTLNIADVTIQGANAGAGAWAYKSGSSIVLSGNSVIEINATSSATFYPLASADLATANGTVGAIFSSVSGVPLAGLKAEQGGSISSTGTTITVHSAGGIGAFAGIPGSPPAVSTIDLFDNHITTDGADSFGLEASSYSRITATGSEISTSGGGAALFVTTFNGPGTIELTNSTAAALGANTSGLFSLNQSSALTNIVSISGGSLTSEQSHAIGAVGPFVVNATSGAQISGPYLLEAFDSPYSQSTVLQLNASGEVSLAGDARADASSVANIDLAVESEWSGAALSITNVGVDATSAWTVTANSVLTQALTNAGLVQFTAPAGGVFKTLTTLNYIGQEGTLGLNTFLETDGSPSDLLVIDGGTASGHSLLSIINAGGEGSATTGDGILVVDAINGGTTGAAAFDLAHEVAAGPYQYLLARGSLDGSEPDDWFLRSSFNCAFAPDDPDCQEPDPEPPIYRPETSLYTALPSLALLYTRGLLDTLHDRVGEEEDLRKRAGLGDDETFNGAWGRLIGKGGRHDGVDIFHGGPSFGYGFVALQAGMDIYRAEDDEGRRDHAGAYAALGILNADVEHSPGIADLPSFTAGTDTLNGYTFGLYATRFWKNGAYFDAVGQVTWYDIFAHSSEDIALRSNGWGVAGSLEAGRPFFGRDGWFVEPQAQLVYQANWLSPASDGAANIDLGNSRGLAGRLGARLGRTWLHQRQNGEEMPATGWFRLNVWYGSFNRSTTIFSSAEGPVDFSSGVARSWLDLNAGISTQADAHTSLYATANYAISFDGNDRSWAGRIGIRANW